MSYIQTLQDVIQQMHGCKSRHAKSVPVHEQFQGKTVWKGVVEIFEIENHSKATKCYAWGHHLEDKDKKSRYIAVLEIPPVNSPETAVRASIISNNK